MAAWACDQEPLVRLRSEVAAEGLVRSLPAFSDFLDAAALSDTSGVNYSNVARECDVIGAADFVRELWQGELA